MTTIAIHPDRIVHRNGERQSFSDRWAELACAAGIGTRVVNAYGADFFDQLRGCDGFMWRFDFAAPERLVAKRLLAAIEHTMPMVLFPSWRTAWHFEDKIAQYYLLSAGCVPVPRTWVFWDRSAALAFCRDAQYPMVLKLAPGYQSNNVRLVKSPDEANYWIDRLFGTGVTSLEEQPTSSLRSSLRRARAAAGLLAGRSSILAGEVQHHYMYLQEFLEGNPFDTRVTVIGNRAFAFRRKNRPNDFRASGSGQIVWDPNQVDMRAVHLAFHVARRLDTQSVAVDVLSRGDHLVVAEVSYTFASWAVRDCPGHWEQCPVRNNGDVDHFWVEGKMKPEDAIFQDFLGQIADERIGSSDLRQCPSIA